MLARALIAAALLTTPAFAATPKHHGHHVARVSTATFRTPMPSRPGRELRASGQGHGTVVHARYAAGHRHVLTRGS